MPSPEWTRRRHGVIWEWQNIIDIWVDYLMTSFVFLFRLLDIFHYISLYAVFFHAMIWAFSSFSKDIFIIYLPSCHFPEMIYEETIPEKRAGSMSFFAEATPCPPCHDATEPFFAFAMPLIDIFFPLHYIYFSGFFFFSQHIHITLCHRPLQGYDAFLAYIVIGDISPRLIVTIILFFRHWYLLIYTTVIFLWAIIFFIFRHYYRQRYHLDDITIIYADIH